MKNQLRSSIVRKAAAMAGARACGFQRRKRPEIMGKPIIAIVNSFSRALPGHTHLHEIGRRAKIKKLGCFAAEFNTIAIDDGVRWDTTVCFILFRRAIS